MKTLRVVLEIEVKELPEDEKEQSRQELGFGEPSEIEEEDGDEPEDEESLFDVDAYSPSELADVIEGGFHEEAVREMFAGSSMYVTFGEVSVKEASWIE